MTETPMGAPSAGPFDGRILIVDDTALNRDMLSEIFRKAGFHDLTLAVDGEEALALAAAIDPDLLVLDLVMPKVDGIEVCKRLRADPRFRTLPIVVQTALSEPKDRTRAFAAGATDFIAKPIDAQEMIARARIHLENRTMIRGLQDYRAAMEREFELARPMYVNLMPAQDRLAEAAVQTGIAAASCAVLGSDFGGDLWGMVPTPDDELAIYMLNVRGNGTIAALAAFNLFTLIEAALAGGCGPAECLDRLNARLAEQGGGLPASVLCGVVSAGRRLMTYATAGAPGPFRLPASGGLSMAPGGGPPLGLFEFERFDERAVPLHAGDRLVLMSAEAVGDGGGPHAVSTALKQGLFEVDGLEPDQTARALAGLLGLGKTRDAAVVVLGHTGGRTPC